MVLLKIDKNLGTAPMILFMDSLYNNKKNCAEMANVHDRLTRHILNGLRLLHHVNVTIILCGFKINVLVQC